MENEEEIIRRAMTLLGRRSSEKKRASSRANAKLPRTKRGAKKGVDTSQRIAKVGKS